MEREAEKEVELLVRTARRNTALESYVLEDIQTTQLNKEIGQLSCLAVLQYKHELFGSLTSEIRYDVGRTDEGKFIVRVRGVD